MADPLKDLFGDPLADVFGADAAQNRQDWTQGPVQSPLLSDLENATPEGARHLQVEERSRKTVAEAHRDLHGEEVSAADPFAGTEEAKQAAEAPPFDPMADLFGGAGASWDSTLAMMRQNRADFAISVRGPTPELVAAAKKAKAEYEAYQKQIPDSGIAQVGANIANLAASMFSSGKQAVSAAEAGAAVGAVGGAAAGAPAGGVGAVPGAIAGAIGGAGVGLAAGFIGDSYVTNAGQILGDLRDAGVDPTLAKGFGMTGGAIMAGLDLFGIGFAAQPFVKAAERKAIQREIGESLKKAAVSEAAKDYFIGIAGETGAETMQQIVQDVTTDLAKQADGGDFQTIFNDPKRRHQVVMNAVQTAVSVAEGMSVLGLPGVAVNASRAARQDQLGTSPVAVPPTPGRSYNVADAMAELGMTPSEAEEFTKTGVDPRKKIDAMKAAGFTPEVTPDDRASDLPDHILVEGKSLLGDALANFDKPSRGKGLLSQTILDGMIARGFPTHTARGVAAGVFAESANDPNAVNKDSGAFGLEQLLGSRKTGLIAQYGEHPTVEQQLDYLAQELRGGDQGGAAVLAAPDENSALQAYIHSFMRPGPAGETGDLERGVAALGQSSTAIQQQAEQGTTPDQPREAAGTVEATLAQAGISDKLGADVEQFAQGQRLDVTRDGETVPGTVQEVYGEGDNQGVKVALDNGDTFDELVKAARDYGARLTHPNDSVAHVFGPEKRTTVDVPEAAQPKSYAGEKIDNEYTAFHPDTGTLNVPRADMPQIKQEHRGAFVNYAEARGITHEEDTVPASSLKPTQQEFAPAKVQKFLDNDAGDRAVLVSSDGYVLDGHHQWIAALDKGADVRVIRLNAPIRDLLPIAHDFPSATTSEGGAGTAAQPDLFSTCSAVARASS
jgi:hypothetical protein